VNVQIVAAQANATNRKMLIDELQGIRGVQGVNERSFVNGIVILDVAVEGVIWKDFEGRLENLPGLSLAVTEKTQNRINVKFLGEGVGGNPSPLPPDYVEQRGSQRKRERKYT
jgi:hypothetical protein